MKRPGVAAGGELPEDSTIETELRFDHEVKEIMWHEGVVAWRWIHCKFRQPRTPRLYGVPPLSRSLEDQHHVDGFIQCGLTSTNPVRVARRRAAPCYAVADDLAAALIANINSNGGSSSPPACTSDTG